MPESQSNRASGAVNPTTTFEIDLLGVAEAGIAVEIPPDIGAIEVVIRDHGQVADVVILAPAQAIAVAQRLISAVLALAEAGEP